MQTPLKMEQVAPDYMVTWTLKLCDQTSLVPYLTEYRSYPISINSWLVGSDYDYNSVESNIHTQLMN